MISAVCVLETFGSFIIKFFAIKENLFSELRLKSKQNYFCLALTFIQNDCAKIGFLFLRYLTEQKTKIYHVFANSVVLAREKNNNSSL